MSHSLIQRDNLRCGLHGSLRVYIMNKPQLPTAQQVYLLLTLLPLLSHYLHSFPSASWAHVPLNYLHPIPCLKLCFQLRKLSVFAVNIFMEELLSLFLGRSILEPQIKVYVEIFPPSHLIVCLNWQLCNLINTVSFSYTCSQLHDIRLSPNPGNAWFLYFSSCPATSHSCFVV